MYETTETAATTALTESTSGLLTGTTVDLILSLTASGTDNSVSFETVAPDASGNVTVAAGSEVVFVDTSDTAPTTLRLPVNAPVVIFQGNGGVLVDFGNVPVAAPSDYGVVDRVVVGSAGSDSITVDGRNSNITIGEGDTVVSGGGNDTIVAGFGNSTVQGGDGFEVVKLQGSAADYNVTIVDGRAVVTNSGSGFATDLSQVQFVQLDGGQGIVFARDAVEAAVTTLYQATFGRLADADGLGYWFDLARAGVSLDTIADGFVNSAEYAAGQGLKTNAVFISELYQNTFGRAASSTETSIWLQRLSSGAVDRGDVLTSFVELAADVIAGISTTEATVVGSVIIVPGIFG